MVTAYFPYQVSYGKVRKFDRFATKKKAETFANKMKKAGKFNVRLKKL